MIIIKKSNPEFYDCRCDKCQAEFIYQLDDIKEEVIEMPEEVGQIFGSMFNSKKYYVVCPCCSKNISIGMNMLPGLNMGFGSR